MPHYTNALVLLLSSDTKCLSAMVNVSFCTLAPNDLITRLSPLIHSSVTANTQSTELLLFAFAVGIVVKCHGCLQNILPEALNMFFCCQITGVVTTDGAVGAII